MLEPKVQRSGSRIKAGLMRCDEMGVMLFGGLDAGMTQHEADGADIGPSLQQEYGEGVAESMRMAVSHAGALAKESQGRTELDSHRRCALGIPAEEILVGQRQRLQRVDRALRQQNLDRRAGLQRSPQNQMLSDNRVAPQHDGVRQPQTGVQQQQQDRPNAQTRVLSILPAPESVNGSVQRRQFLACVRQRSGRVDARRLDVRSRIVRQPAALLAPRAEATDVDQVLAGRSGRAIQRLAPATQRLLGKLCQQDLGLHVSQRFKGTAVVAKCRGPQITSLTVPHVNPDRVGERDHQVIERLLDRADAVIGAFPTGRIQRTANAPTAQHPVAPDGTLASLPTAPMFLAGFAFGEMPSVGAKHTGSISGWLEFGTQIWYVAAADQQVITYQLLSDILLLVPGTIGLTENKADTAFGAGLLCSRTSNNGTTRPHLVRQWYGIV